MEDVREDAMALETNRSIHPATRIVGTAILGGLATLLGGIAGSIEGLFSSFAMPTNSRALYRKVPRELEMAFKSKLKKSYFERIFDCTYSAVKYPVRVAGNIGLLGEALRRFSVGDITPGLILATTNAISLSYEVYRARKRSAEKEI